MDSLRLQVSWLFSVQVWELPQYDDFLQLGAKKQTALLKAQRKRMLGTEFPLDIPPSIMEIADKAYTSVFSTEDIIALFGANPSQHPNRCKQWRTLLLQYIERFTADLSRIIPDYAGPHKKCVGLLSNSLRFLLLTDLTRDTRNRRFGCVFYTSPPLITPTIVHDLLYLVSPDERNADMIAAWKAAWTSVSCGTYSLSCLLIPEL